MLLHGMALEFFQHNAMLCFILLIQSTAGTASHLFYTIFYPRANNRSKQVPFWSKHKGDLRKGLKVFLFLFFRLFFTICSLQNVNNISVNIVRFLRSVLNPLTNWIRSYGGMPINPAEIIPP